MPFRPSDDLPDFDSLQPIFTGALQQTENNPFYQTIVNFLRATSKLKRLLNGRIITNTSSISNLANAQYATVADESTVLPNSRQLLAGTGIAFDDTVANERTISSTPAGVRDAGYWTPLILDGEDNGDSELIITDANAPIAVWNPTP